MKKNVLFTIFKLWKSDIWKIRLRAIYIWNKKKFQFIFIFMPNFKFHFWHEYKTTNKTYRKKDFI